MVLVGIDWSEKWHEVCLMDEGGQVLNQGRVDDSPAGLTQLQSMIAEHAADPSEVVIGIETPHGLMVRGLRAAGYVIYAVNPLAASRYRDRHSVSKKKSDRGDAKMLADLVRTDRHQHRQPGTSPITQSSGRTKVVMARFIRNDRLADVCHWWAFAALSASPGARRYYDLQRARHKSHSEALRILGNRLVGILHGCLRHHQLYREDIAWPLPEPAAA